MSLPRILVAPNSYKETFDASAVAAAMADGVVSAGADPIVMPLSDGGDGLLDALSASQRIVSTEESRVTGPLGDPISVRFAWLPERTAVIESRLVVGLSLVPEQRRDPWVTTTRGLGELVVALRDRAKTVIIGLGGSATMDGGLDMARAWGWRPKRSDGSATPLGGGGLAELAVLAPGSSPPLHIVALADVENPLLGPAGAAVYGRQKGATPRILDRLTQGLAHLVSLLGPRAEEIAARPGSGAAGGLGFGVQYFGGGKLVSGADWVMQQLGFAERLAGVSGVVTGEGAFDGTSMVGKAPGDVIRLALARGVPVALLAPAASGVPAAVVVETGGGRWTLDDVRNRTARAVRTLLSLPRH